MKPPTTRTGSRPAPVCPQIDDPLELLRTCHGKVLHFCGLMSRLSSHVRKQGLDLQAREAARAIVRYFDLAAPLHHRDEEEDLFPALRALGDEVLQAHLDSLARMHPELEDHWQRMRPVLEALSDGNADVLPLDEPVWQSFADAYRRHVEVEETLVYPHAVRLDADRLATMARAMVARRSPGAAAGQAVEAPTGD